MKLCSNCSRSLNKYSIKYCSNVCQKNFEYQQFIARWKLGQHDGNRGKSTKNISSHVSKYIFKKYNFECARCRWKKRNPITNKPPLEIDHIDGNAQNNRESNLILLCPNCHSLTHTYKNLNKGYGRSWRREKYVKMI